MSDAPRVPVASDALRDDVLLPEVPRRLLELLRLLSETPSLIFVVALPELLTRDLTLAPVADFDVAADEPRDEVAEPDVVPREVVVEPDVVPRDEVAELDEVPRDDVVVPDVVLLEDEVLLELLPVREWVVVGVVVVADAALLASYITRAFVALSAVRVVNERSGYLVP